MACAAGAMFVCGRRLHKADFSVVSSVLYAASSSSSAQLIFLACSPLSRVVPQLRFTESLPARCRQFLVRARSV